MESSRVCRPIVLAAAFVCACGKQEAAPAREARASAPGVAVSAPAIGEWAPELGSTLVVPSDTEDMAVVLYPVVTDANTIATAKLALLTPGGDTVRALSKLAGLDSLHCGEVPVARLEQGAPMTWSVGLESAEATPVRTDSMESLSAADSAFYSVDLSRLASAVAAEGTSGFTGLPFVVTTVRRMRLDRLEVVAAQLVRRVNQEANPLEERTLIIAERASGSRRARLALVHSERSEGSEDTAEHFEVLAAMRTPRTTLLILARDQLSSTTYEVLERAGMAPGSPWRVRWSRSVAC